ncbi:metal-dependent hydrolase [Halalkalibaculum sp. DA3122]|uniref:metal-dependent hydrolase n=1 Tax=Halalkalibaculum sp. DA3122 TaxID=3373607 RepID=UPI003754201B
MDTITQITLGAAVGEAVLGRRIENKAPLWGAVLGVVPDLDILANPFLTEVQQIVAHRGITHSILFCLLTPPLFGWLLAQLKWNQKAGWKQWSGLVFWVFSTHIFIDVCTSYGTQVFQPFSNYAASFNSIFIIDPFYTVPLLGGILVALFLNRNLHKRRWANYLGLGISSFYLLMGFGVKWHVNTVFEDNSRQQNMAVDRYMTTPAPLTIFLWTGYLESGDDIHVGLYSIFDNDQEIDFITLPRQSDLIAPYRDDLPVQRLLWFSNGYYTVEKRPDGLIFSDLRFGRSDLWLSGANPSSAYVWNYKLEFNGDSTQVTGIRHFEPSFDTRKGMFGQLFNRILGE